MTRLCLDCDFLLGDRALLQFERLLLDCGSLIRDTPIVLVEAQLGITDFREQGNQTFIVHRNSSPEILCHQNGLAGLVGIHAKPIRRPQRCSTGFHLAAAANDMLPRIVDASRYREPLSQGTQTQRIIGIATTTTIASRARPRRQ
jgi:hypothetical protein